MGIGPCGWDAKGNGGRVWDPPLRTRPAGHIGAGEHSSLLREKGKRIAAPACGLARDDGAGDGGLYAPARAFRSTLPLGVRGIRSSCSMRLGSMYRGSFSFKKAVRAALSAPPV